MSGPDFSRVGVVDEEELVDAKDLVDNLLHDIQLGLEERGVPAPAKPRTEAAPLADIDITKLTNNELATIYTQYVAYTAYIGDQLAQVEGQEECTKKLLKDTLANLKNALFAKGHKGPEATAAAIRDPLYVGLDKEHAKLFFIKALTKRRYDGFVAQAAALSRCIELRKLDFEQARRDGNTGYASRPTPRGFGPRNK